MHGRRASGTAAGIGGAGRLVSVSASVPCTRGRAMPAFAGQDTAGGATRLPPHPPACGIGPTSLPSGRNAAIRAHFRQGLILRNPPCPSKKSCGALIVDLGSTSSCAPRMTLHDHSATMPNVAASTRSAPASPPAVRRPPFEPMGIQPRSSAPPLQSPSCYARPATAGRCRGSHTARRGACVTCRVSLCSRFDLPFRVVARYAFGVNAHEDQCLAPRDAGGCATTSHAQARRQG